MKKSVYMIHAEHFSASLSKNAVMQTKILSEVINMKNY